MTENGDALDGDLRVPSCERCPALVESRSRIVDGVGPTDADLLFVGEGPGAQEDERASPSWGGPATCSTTRSGTPDSRGRTCGSRTACGAARRTTGTRRPRSWRTAAGTSTPRSTDSTPN